EIELVEPFGDFVEERRSQAGTDEDDAQRIDVAAERDAAQQRGFENGGATAHEWIIDNVAGFGQSFDEEARQLRFEAGAVGNFVERTGLALAGGPEFIHEGRDFAWSAGEISERRGQLSGGLAELAKGGK